MNCSGWMLVSEKMATAIAADTGDLDAGWLRTPDGTEVIVTDLGEPVLRRAISGEKVLYWADPGSRSFTRQATGEAYDR